MSAFFTGNSRKPRQINLSGRNNNPWAAVSGAGKSAQPQLGSHNAVAQAQAERARRAHERDRLTAARKVQRLWRGHASRREQKQKWREEWDQNEQARLHRTSPLAYDFTREQEQVIPFRDEETCRYQIRLLISFLDTHKAMDRWRLCYTARMLEISWRLIEDSPNTILWNQYFSKLSRIVVRAIGHSQDEAQQRMLLKLGIAILDKPIKLDYDTHFSSLSIITSINASPAIIEGSSSYSQALLLRRSPLAYDAFVHHIVSSVVLETLPQMARYLAIEKNQTAYCESVRRVAPTMNINHQMWILANTIYLWQTLEAQDKVIGWISAISSALTKCANEISLKVDTVDYPMNGISENKGSVPLPVTLRQRIISLAQQDSVREVMKVFQVQTPAITEVAKPLANYAVALLRAFPNKATNIRMWLYQSSPSSTGRHEPSSTIQYLWKASQSTTVFQRVTTDQNQVISVLTESKPPSNQLGYRPATAEETLTWQEEWRILLLFLELYTFILKLMDDEEFFALDGKRIYGSAPTQQFMQGALPLSDVASLGDFLKHLAFALYWNAADLAEYNDIDDHANISALFGQSPAYRSSNRSGPAAKTLAGNDVSQAYMKGLATGLLRMLYERDSRRKFLPENYWLMTKHFDMQGFIPAVVAEEERRHEAMDGEDNQDEFDIDEHYEDTNDEPKAPNLGSLFGIRDPHTPRSQTSRQAEQLNKQREQARKHMQLQSLHPRIEILRNLPFFIPFDTRVQIFRRFIYRDQERRRNGNVDPDQWRMSIAASQGRNMWGEPTRSRDAISRHHADINRGSVFEDAFETFYGLGEELKEPIQISFIDQFGQPEAGIDGGGVTKEFLMSVTSEALDPHSQLALFEENDQRYLYPKPTALQQAKQILSNDGNPPGTEGYNFVIRGILQRYEFLGRIVGKCMYEGILIDVNFAGFFLLKWALTGGTTTATTESAFRASVNDLKDFDHQLYQGLLKLKNYTGDVESDFSLNFAVSDTFDADGKMVSTTTDLIPHGSRETVTAKNRLRYIDRIVRYRLQEQPRMITNAFLKGLGQIISPMWLAMFNQKELQKLVGGDNQELDINDLRRHTEYSGIYSIGDDGLEHPIVNMFWKVLKEMSDENRRKVLKFVTSTPRAPLLGFSHLNPRFSIRDSSEDQSRLPSTSTCVNLLKLPRYADENTMRTKLLYAANAGAGFDLS